MRALVVDDERGIREVCQRALAEEGAEVAVAGSGVEALGRLEEGWDLVITDVAMPGGVDGIEVLGRARQRGAAVMVMTAYPDLGSTLAALHLRASDYLIKPFSASELRLAYRRWAGPRAEASSAPDGAAPAAAAEASTVVALFGDLRGFSRFAAEASPEEAARALADLLPPAMDAIRAHGGAVQQVMGDGFLALFGASAPAGAAIAAAAALEARAAAASAAAGREVAGLRPLAMGFGMELGRVIANPLGGGDGRQLTFVGHAINVAARLEKAAPAGGILVGPAVAERLRKLCRLDPVPPLRLHGLDEPMAAFELLPLPDR